MKGALDVLSLMVIWLCIGTVWTLFLGSVGLLHCAGAGGLSCVGLVLIVFFARSQLQNSARTLLRVIASLFRNHAVIWFTIGMGAIVVRHAIHTWVLAPYIYDTLTYHLPKVADWIQHARLVALDTPVVRSYWPANFELLQAWAVVFFHHDVIIESPGIAFYLLSVGSVGVIARSLGLSRGLACLTAFAFASTPTLLINAVTCKNDIAITGMFLFAKAHLSDANRTGLKPQQRIGVLAAGLGFACGTKPTIFFLMSGAALYASVVLWQKRHKLSAPFRGRFQSPLATISLLLTGGVLAGFWYARSFFLFGNPLYPVPSKLFAATEKVPGIEGLQQGAFKFSSLYETLYTTLTYRIFDFGRFTGDVGGTCGWGWFAVTCGIPAVLWALLRWSTFRLFALSLLFSLVVLLGFVAFDPWNMRFTTWFPAIFAIAFGGLIRDIPFQPIRLNLLLLCALCILLNLVGSMGTGLYQYSDWKMKIKTPVLERAVWAGQEDLLGRVPPGETLGYIVHGDHWIYPLYKPDFSQRVVYVNRKPGESYEEAMRRMNVKYVFIWHEAVNDPSLQKEIERGALHDLGRYVFRLGHGSRS